MLSLLIYILLQIYPANAAAGILPEHQACHADSDCIVVTVGCACIHNSTCARPDDKKKGFVVAVTKKFTKNYESLSKCSGEESGRCATMGACATVGSWQPKCQKKLCEPVFKPRKF